MYILAGTGGGVRTQHNLTNRSDLLIRVEDQTEGTEVDYTTLGDRTVHVISKECPADLQCPRRGGLIVARVRRGNGVGTLNETQYQYTDARVDPRGRGFLGFQSVRTIDPRGTARYRTYDLASSETVNGVLRFPGSRIPIEERTSLAFSGSGRTHEQIIARKIQSFPSGSELLPQTRAMTETTTTYDGGAVIQEITNSIDYDADALPWTTSRVVSGGSQTVMVFNRSSSTASAPYFIGRVDSVITTSYPLATESRAMTRVVATTYTAANDIDTQTLWDTAGSRDVVTRYIRTPSSRGQVTRIEMTGYEPSGFTGTTWTPITRSADIGYDADYIFPTTSTNSLGQTDTTWTDPVLGVAIRHQNVSGETDTTAFDGFGRIVRERSASGAGADISYAATTTSYGMVTVRVDGTDGSLAIATLDKLGRSIASQQEIQTATGVRMATTTQAYDSVGRVRWVTNPYFGTTIAPRTEWTYDELDRPTRERRQDGVSRYWAYAGRTTTATDFKGFSQTTTLDPEMRFYERDEGAGGLVTRYEYGFFGQLEHVRVNGRAWDYIANNSSIGLPEYTVDPDAGRRDYLFNTFGELRAARDAGMNVNVWTRDALGRTTRLDSTEDGATTWTWDGSLVGPGRLETACAHVGTASANCTGYTYTSSGQVQQELRTNTVGVLRTNYTYSSVGQLNGITYPARTGTRPMVRYQYDAAGMLAVVDNLATSAPYFSVQDRNAWGHATNERSGTVTSTAGVVTTRLFDDIGRMQATASRTGSAGSFIQNIAYGFDNNGNVRTRNDLVSGANETMTYDRLNRILTWARVGTPSENYGYDNWGNPTAMRSSSSTTANQTFGTASVGMRPHALARGFGQTADNQYDANGRLSRSTTASGVQEHTWTSFGVPRRVTRPSSVTLFDYGPNHERVRRYVTATDQIVYAGDLYENRIAGNNNSQVFHIFAEGREVAQLERGSTGAETVLYPLSDAQGTASTIATASGAVFERHQFSPWGRRVNAASSSSIRHRFTGHEAEDNLGLINMRGRVYDPIVGRFLTPDPITQAPTRAQGLNRYSYVFNNPASNTDPTGYQVSPYSPATPIGVPSAWRAGVGAPDFSVGSDGLVIAGMGVPTSDIGGVSTGLSTSGYLAYGGAGLLVGVGTTWAAAAVMGALMVASPALGVLVAVAAFSWGVAFLGEQIGTGHFGEMYGRFSTGDATGEDVFEVSAMAGGLMAGPVGGSASSELGARGMTSFMARVGGRSISVDVAGTATIYRYPTADPAGHFSILVEAADGSTMHTHQVATSGGHTTIVNYVGNARSYQSTNPPLHLPNASAAIRYQASVIREPGGLYNGVNNSCATHCAQVMQAGGRADVPTGRPLFAWWSKLMREQ
jgi:RHS repeat-associated protein